MRRAYVMSRAWLYAACLNLTIGPATTPQGWQAAGFVSALRAALHRYGYSAYRGSYAAGAHYAFCERAEISTAGAGPRGWTGLGLGLGLGVAEYRCNAGRASLTGATALRIASARHRRLMLLLPWGDCYVRRR